MVHTTRLIVTYRLATDRGPAAAFGARGLILELPAYVAGSFSWFSLNRNPGILLYGEDLVRGANRADNLAEIHVSVPWDGDKWTVRNHGLALSTHTTLAGLFRRAIEAQHGD
jgi:hypothetical protein